MSEPPADMKTSSNGALRDEASQSIQSTAAALQKAIDTFANVLDPEAYKALCKTLCDPLLKIRSDITVYNDLFSAGKALEGSAHSPKKSDTSTTKDPNPTNVAHSPAEKANEATAAAAQVPPNDSDATPPAAKKQKVLNTGADNDEIIFIDAKPKSTTEPLKNSGGDSKLSKNDTPSAKQAQGAIPSTPTTASPQDVPGSKGDMVSDEQRITKKRKAEQPAPAPVQPAAPAQPAPAQPAPAQPASVQSASAQSTPAQSNTCRNRVGAIFTPPLWRTSEYVPILILETMPDPSLDLNDPEVLKTIPHVTVFNTNRITSRSSLMAKLFSEKIVEALNPNAPKSLDDGDDKVLYHPAYAKEQRKNLPHNHIVIYWHNLFNKWSWNGRKQSHLFAKKHSHFVWFCVVIWANSLRSGNVRIRKFSQKEDVEKFAEFIGDDQFELDVSSADTLEEIWEEEKRDRAWARAPKARVFSTTDFDEHLPRRRR